MFHQIMKSITDRVNKIAGHEEPSKQDVKLSDIKIGFDFNKSLFEQMAKEFVMHRECFVKFAFDHEPQIVRNLNVYGPREFHVVLPSLEYESLRVYVEKPKNVLDSQLVKVREIV